MWFPIILLLHTAVQAPVLHCTEEIAVLMVTDDTIRSIMVVGSVRVGVGNVVGMVEMVHGGL